MTGIMNAIIPQWEFDEMSEKHRDFQRDAGEHPEDEQPVELDRSFEQWIASFTKKKHRDRHKYTIDGFDGEFCIVFDCDEDTDRPEITSRTCDILIERITDSEETVRVVADAGKHQVMRFLAAIGINRMPDKVKSAFYALTQPVTRTDSEGRDVTDLPGLWDDNDKIAS